MHGNAQPMAARSVGQNSGHIFPRLWTKVQLNKVRLCMSVRSLQRHFPIDDIVLCSRDIRDQVLKLPKFLCFWPPNLG